VDARFPSRFEIDSGNGGEDVDAVRRLTKGNDAVTLDEVAFGDTDASKAKRLEYAKEPLCVF
jgi:hypothetical protein